MSVVVGNNILFGTVFLVCYTAAIGLEPTAWLISEFVAATAYTILPFIACNLACHAAGRSGGDKAEKDRDADGGEKTPSLILTTSSPKPPAMHISPLIVSDTILGYGSHGTTVYQGSFQGRPVAVKRLVQGFVTLATHEASILQQSDNHPNVIRYYYQESHRNFFYIALELCPASLADIIESPHEWREIMRGFDAKRAMRQVASGLRHLHGLGLIHRDIKPQNILISPASSLTEGRDGTGYRMLISDFGLCKKLDVDQTSFLPTANGAVAAGTVGWRAPEILRGEVKLDELSTGDDSTSSRGSVATVKGTPSTPGTTTTTKTHLTKSVDIFALGCLFYYTLTNGGHPYGDRFEREGNILKDNKQLSLLPHFCSKEESEAQDLITQMLDPQPSRRPDTKICLLHPFFWDPTKRLSFLQETSDRFEVMCKDSGDAALIILEKDAASVVGDDWHGRLDKMLIENLGKYRKYDGKSVQALMRALRNKKNHYQDLPDNVKVHLGSMPEGFLGYFTCRYPKLFMHVHGVVKDTGLHDESMFRTYFELSES
ncbi:kinase-like protein [Phlegmacium glaucopus]|nr:kinase-like protein [Phlegmacium glaucopus]